MDVDRLHRSTVVVDGHVHLTNAVQVQGIDPWTSQPTGLFDLARAVEGGLGVVVDHLFVEDACTRAGRTVEQALQLLETAHRMVADAPERIELARTVADVRRIVASGRVAFVLALEGGIPPDGDRAILERYRDLGVRMIQLTNHDTTNDLVDAYAGELRHAGLSARGRDTIAALNELGLVVDASHAPDHAKRQIARASRAPVVTSHNGLARFGDVIGNLTSDTLEVLAATGGLVGLHGAGWILTDAAAAWGSTPSRLRGSGVQARSPATFGSLDAQVRELWLTRWGFGRPWRAWHADALAAGAPLPTVDDWARQAAWVARTFGAGHVGIGLDLMAGGNWLRDFDATSYPRLTGALLRTGLDEPSIRAILGENWLRVLERAEAAAV
jgi:membrane dipeptidase